MASRIPRAFQRAVYRHRRSITLSYSQLKQFGSSLFSQTLTNHQNLRVMHNSCQHVTMQSQAMAKLEDSALLFQHFTDINKVNNIPNSMKNCIEIELFDHSKADLDNFQTHLKNVWNFVPKHTCENSKQRIATIEFEHESQSPQFPTIVVKHLQHQPLPKPTEKAVDPMIDIPNYVQFNLLQNETVLVCEQMGDSITIQEFEPIQNQPAPIANFVPVVSNFNSQNQNENHHGRPEKSL